MSDENLSAKLDAFKIVNDHYRNDFQLFWRRTNFYLISDSGLLGFFVSKVLDNPLQSRSFSLAACISGATLSFIWFLVSLSSIYWIDIWRKQVVLIDNDVNPYNSFSVGENIEQKQWQFQFIKYFRPEIISTCVPLLFLVIWMFLAYFLFHREIISQ
jgi:hypothetical protein